MLSDEALLALDRSELVEMAQQSFTITSFRQQAIDSGNKPR